MERGIWSKKKVPLEKSFVCRFQPFIRDFWSVKWYSSWIFQECLCLIKQLSYYLWWLPWWLLNHTHLGKILLTYSSKQSRVLALSSVNTTYLADKAKSNPADTKQKHDHTGKSSKFASGTSVKEERKITWILRKRHKVVVNCAQDGGLQWWRLPLVLQNKPFSQKWSSQMPPRYLKTIQRNSRNS